MRQHVLETIFDEFDGLCMELDHEKRKVKYAKMTESAFRFFRGSAYLFYYDMTKIPFSFHTPEDKPTWIQGDLHMENFGAFQNERGDIVYDVNDFDEGYIGSYLYDVLRMSVSIALYAEAQGLTEKEQKARISNYLKSYYEQLKRFAKGKDDPFTLTFTKKNTDGAVKKLLKKLEQRQSDHLLEDITYVDEQGERRFVLSEEMQAVSKKDSKMLHSMLNAYIHSIDEENKQHTSFYKVKDMAVKHGTGTASIGLDRFYILIEGTKDASGTDDLVLEVKEVRSPVPAYFLPYHEPFWNKYTKQGARVVATQKAMHHLEDPHLGHFTMDGRDFYVRERSPYKKKVKAEKLVTAENFDVVLDVMGKVTAKIHARADVDSVAELFEHHSEEEILAAIGDDFDVFRSQITFAAMMYKQQVNEDYELFCQWVAEKF